MHPSRSPRDRPCATPLGRQSVRRNPIIRTPRVAPMPRLLLSLLAAAAAVLSACGSDEGGTTPAPPEPMAARPADFPSAKGKSLADLERGLPKGAILTVSSFSSQKPGRDNRLGFAI